MPNTLGIIRDLKINMNNEEHTDQDWNTIIKELQGLVNKAHQRFTIKNGNFLEIIEDE